MNNPIMNPIMQAVNLMRSGRNPMQLFQQMAGNNPMMGQFMQMVNGKGSGQLRQMAMNVAKERGISVEQVAQQLGISLPGSK